MYFASSDRIYARVMGVLSEVASRQPERGWKSFAGTLDAAFRSAAVVGYVLLERKAGLLGFYARLV